MNEAITATPRGVRRGVRAKLWSGVVGAWAAVAGAAPHVLHHVGPLAGAAIVSGVTGRIVFAVAGFALMIPMLHRMRRRSGSWRAPMVALALFVSVYLVSSFVIGPRLTGTTSSKETRTPTEQKGDSHASHHGG